VRVASDSDSSSSTSRFRGFLELVARNWSAAIAFPCEPLPLVLQIYLIFGFGFAIIKCCEFVVLEKEDEGASTVL
jgi:membrane protein insertase Oxa1/YidC/SpoIIIJ